MQTSLTLLNTQTTDKKHENNRNGADSFDTLEYLEALARTENDLPALVFYSLIGNLELYIYIASVFSPSLFCKLIFAMLLKKICFRE